jgi:hypothetical protein
MSLMAWGQSMPQAGIGGGIEWRLSIHERLTTSD